MNCLISRKRWLRPSQRSPLQKQIDRGYLEKLAFEHEVRVLRGNLESRDKDVEELRSEISRQLDHYNDLWEHSQGVA